MSERERGSQPENSDSNDGSGFRSVPEMLLAPILRIIRSWNVGNARFVGDTWKTMLPYSYKSIRQRKWRAGMLALSVALTIVVFVVFTSFYNATETAFRGEVEEVTMVADVVAYSSEPWPAETTHRLNFARAAESFDIGYRTKIYSSLGYEFLIGLDQAAFEPRSYPEGQRPDAQVPSDLQMQDGRWPQNSHEVAVPTRRSEDSPVRVGDQFTIQWLDENNQLHRKDYEIVGHFTVEDPILEQPITRLPYEEDLGPFVDLQTAEDEIRPGGNLILIRSQQPSRVQQWLSEQFPPTVHVITADQGKEMATGLFWQLFSGGRIMVFLVMLFSGLGVLNVLLLNFLERRRDIGIFKAEGTLDEEVRIMLMQEGFLMALGGVTSGLILSWIAVRLLDAYTMTPYLLSPINLVIASVLAMLVFYIGALVPAGMAKRMTVNHLLYRRNIL